MPIGGEKKLGNTAMDTLFAKLNVILQMKSV